ncbi:ARF guanine-nucleotide exchange factor GNL2 [Glycine soja]|uniref:ARF guanine-nucleotide exchange factor GNL2 n=1 Tax=Glycine soja TaxID=3848 RepID=A0A445JUA6_GLYSO|nr:ARF guanine-nucleotide exchange factor GNL2 [Glycine soja]
MTEEEFIRNNRAINAGKDLPREYLSELFQSISTCAFSLEQTTGSLDMNPMVAALSSFFEHADEEEMLHECIEGLLSVARICQYGLEDTLDEFITSFCKFTTLLNPYASIEETMFTFSHDLKPRMATVAVFTIANYFRDSIQGGWKNIVDCLLKLKKIKLLPQSVVDFKSVDVATTPESGVMSPTDDHKFGSQRVASMISWFSHLSSEKKAILGLLRVCLKLFSAPRDDKLAEELIFKNSSVDKKKILDLLADSVKLLIHWHRNQYSDPGSNVSIASYTSNSSFKDNSRAVSFWPHFRFSPSPLKTLSFSRSPPNQSQKNDDLEPVHRWIVMKFEYHVRNTIPRILTVGNFDIMSELRETPFAL